MCLSWGRGVAVDESMLTRLEAALSASPSDLSTDELRTLRQMIATYEMFLAGGKLGKFFIWFVLGLSGLIAACIKLAYWFAAAVQASGKT